MTLDLKQKRVIVIGLGKSGLAAARFLREEGATVVANDVKSAAEVGAAAVELKSLGCELHLGMHDPKIVSGGDLVVLSPGVPPGIPPVVEADRLGIPVLSELELAARFLTVPIVAITGTNGKSTVTELVGRILARDHAVFVGGNLGRPAVEACTRSERGSGFASPSERIVRGKERVCERVVPPDSTVVLEVSSFQLERAPAFHPWIAAILNVTEDHLDRYPSFKHYKRAKLGIFGQQGAGDFLVLNAGDPALSGVAGRPGSHTLHFALGPLAGEGAGLEGTDLVWKVGRGKAIRFPIEGLKLQGLHNIENALAAGLIALLAGAPASSVTEVLGDFEGLPHRMQIVGQVRDVTYIDDSKATNVGSAVASLAGLPDGRVIWIAGGRDKGGDYAPLVSAVKKKSASPFLSGRRRKRSPQPCRRRSIRCLQRLWRMPCGWPTSGQNRGIASFWPRPARALICSRIMRSEERCLPKPWGN